jgi:hypothetical protein
MKTVLGIALLVSVLVNAFLLYRLLDTGVTVTYGAAEISYKQKQEAAAEKLLPLLLANTSRDSLLDAARRAGLEIIDKGTDGVYVGKVHFMLSNDHVTAVTFE